jgi:hypothetical protein
MANTGNVVHSVCVFHLLTGPIWLLPTCYLVTTAIMLCWFLRYPWQPQRVARVSTLCAITGAGTCTPTLLWPGGRLPQAPRIGLRTGNTPAAVPRPGHARARAAR